MEQFILTDKYCRDSRIKRIKNEAEKANNRMKMFDRYIPWAKKQRETYYIPGINGR